MQLKLKQVSNQNIKGKKSFVNLDVKRIGLSPTRIYSYTSNIFSHVTKATKSTDLLVGEGQEQMEVLGK